MERAAGWEAQSSHNNSVCKKEEELFMSTRPTRLRLMSTFPVCCALALSSQVPLLQAQTPQQNDAAIKLAAETKKAKEQISKIGPGNDVTIVRRDGQEFYGRIEKIEDDLVAIYDVDLKAKVEIRFEQIKQVSKGYGHTRAWNGKRIPPKKRRIGLMVGLAALVVPIILVAAAKD